LYAAIEVKYSVVDPNGSTKEAPNLDLKSEYEVTTVGKFTGPFTVGPTRAAPTEIGPVVI
jgi:hypothetical protein